MVANRFFYYRNPTTNEFGIYEHMPEDGQEVRRKIAVVPKEAQAKAFIKLHKQRYKEYLESILHIQDAANARDIDPPLIDKTLEEILNPVMPALKTPIH